MKTPEGHTYTCSTDLMCMASATSKYIHFEPIYAIDKSSHQKKKEMHLVQMKYATG